MAHRTPAVWLRQGLPCGRWHVALGLTTRESNTRADVLPRRPRQVGGERSYGLKDHAETKGTKNCPCSKQQPGKYQGHPACVRYIHAGRNVSPPDLSTLERGRKSVLHWTIYTSASNANFKKILPMSETYILARRRPGNCTPLMERARLCPWPRMEINRVGRPHGDAVLGSGVHSRPYDAKPPTQN